MCEQCSAEVDEFMEVIPKWLLIRATRNSFSMKEGQWGLVWANDPSFIWTETPVVDPHDGMPDEQVDALPKEEFDKFFEWAKKAEDFEKSLMGSPFDGYTLYKAALDAGYDRKTDGRFSFWLFNRMGKLLAANPKPTAENHPFTGISKEQAKAILKELADNRGITIEALDAELTEAANKVDLSCANCEGSRCPTCDGCDAHCACR